MGALPPVFVEFIGKSAGLKTAMADVKEELAATPVEGEKSFNRFGSLAKAAVMGIGIAAAAAAVGAVKMAADFQTQMTRVRTGAGETAGNMKMVSDGILAMAGEVGQSTSQLTSGLYTVESAGYHGAAALNVLKVSAMGAKVGAADMATVTDAVTTALNAYKLGAGQATAVTNALIGTEAEGKTNMEALAGSMANILPTASAAHVGLNEVLGAMATMTAQGTPAAVAATYLRQTIGQLSNPSAKAADEMKNLGLSAVSVGQELGKQGLAATLTTITNAIQQHMGPAGTVLITKLQGAAKNATAFQKVLANLPPTQQTYIGALATMVGGTKSMQAALELTGAHMKDFKANTAGIADHVKKGGKSIEGWSDVQKTLNQKLAEAKGALQAMTIQIGQALLPVATRIMGVIAQTVTWFTKHKIVAEALAVIIGVALVAAIVAATMAMYSFVTSAAVLEAIPWVAAITAIIIVIILLATHWKQVWGFIKTIALDVWHALETAWDAVVSATKTAWHAVSNAVVVAWNAVVSFFVSAYHMVVDPIVAGWNLIWSITKSVWDAIAGFFRRWWPLLLLIFAAPIALLMAAWNHFHKQMEAVAKAVWNGTTAFFKAIWKGIVATAKAIWALIKLAVITPVIELWHGLEAIWKTIVNSVLKPVWNGIKSMATMAWNGIKWAMINPIESALSKLMGLVKQIGSTIYNGFRGAWNQVKNVGSWFISIGKSIVEGIVNGVESAAGSLYSSLGNLAEDALSSAKSFLGINSPSKVFAKVVGMAIPEGIAKGVTDHAHLAHGAVGRLSASLSGQSVNIGTASGPNGFSSAFSARSGGGLTVNLTVQGNVLTERNLRDAVEELFLQLGGRRSQTWPAYAK